MLMLFVANCAFLVAGIIIPVIDGVVPITQFAPLVISVFITVALSFSEDAGRGFNERRPVYSTLSAVLVAIGAVSAFLGLTSAWISSISGLLLLVLVSIVVDKKRTAPHKAGDRK
ncbi:hypothetical protein [Brevibacterium spongiae]|uniref:Uncharacterized protein n=1 Tax=Brevibacterium spongiae TaxID=2909672 RepID=A0ABY5SQI1_9MICO|nr:hypothetical protein [Brevibacterium spongiae]UVI36812.1 hypothetical protein L1F31_03895 [Brevibacterium spongiae]